MQENEFYLVEASALPEIFHRIMRAKNYLASGKARTVAEAASRAGVSRSTFYKYKDRVFAYHDNARGKIVTLSFTVLDQAGVLSEIAGVLAKKGADVLTINQNIPVDGVANVTISFRTGNLRGDVEKLIDRLSHINGVNRVEIIAGE